MVFQMSPFCCGEKGPPPGFPQICWQVVRQPPPTPTDFRGSGQHTRFLHFFLFFVFMLVCFVLSFFGVVLLVVGSEH